MRQGVHRCFGSIAPGVACGLMLPHDHGSNYMSGDFQDEIECVIFFLLPCYAEIGPCYFFRGISLEIHMKSAFVDDIAGIFRPIFAIFPCILPCYVENEFPNPTASSASHSGGLFRRRRVYKNRLVLSAA